MNNASWNFDLKFIFLLLFSTVYLFANVGEVTNLKGEVYIQRDASSNSNYILEKNNIKLLLRTMDFYPDC